MLSSFIFEAEATGVDNIKRREAEAGPPFFQYLRYLVAFR